MRTTLDISDDAYHIAKAVARDQKRSLGAVVSDFIKGELGGQSPPPAHPAGKYFFPTFRARRVTTMEDVRAAVDDEE